MARHVTPTSLVALLLGISVGLQGCGHSGGGGGGDDDLGNGKPNYVNYTEEFTAKCAGPFKNSDMSADWGAAMWSGENAGRGDLLNMRTMGANTVRLYGNDPRMSKAKFFNYARKNSMQVVEGLTGWLYNQGGGPMCATAERTQSCHDAVYDAIYGNLLHGFMEGKYYHNAISIINLANEPDFFGVPGSPTKGPNYMWAMISAFDGLLSAEKAAGVKPWNDGSLPHITCTWSYSLGKAQGQDICLPEYGILDRDKECGPGYAFMVQFARAVADPEKYVGYKPKNDILKAFHERWINSVQLFVHAEQVQREFMDHYAGLSQTRDFPVVATEWNAPPGDTSVPFTTDMRALDKLRHVHPQFYGASVFQYQVAYNKDGAERLYGLFGLGTSVIGYTQAWTISDDYGPANPVNCLVKKETAKIDGLVEVWGGQQPSHGLCASDVAAEFATLLA